MRLTVLRALFVMLVAAVPTAWAAEETLTVHHFLGPRSTTHARMIVPWAERLAAQSDGRLEVRVFPGMTLGGRPPELFRQVRDGVADVVWTLIGYTPGVFPRAEVFELPTVHRGSAAATNRAIQDVFPLLAEDFADIHPILVHVHAGNALVLAGPPDGGVGGVDNLRGLKLRTPSRTGAWLIDAWGAEPVGMPLPDLPQALAKGAVDGALVPFEIVAPLRLHELSRLGVEGADGSRFGTSVFLFAMNKDRYQSLPADLRAVIDGNSGAALAGTLGEIWDAAETAGIDALRAAGGAMVGLGPVAMAAFDARAETVVDRWIDEVAARGIDGAALVAAARAAVGRHAHRGR